MLTIRIFENGDEENIIKVISSCLEELFEDKFDDRHQKLLKNDIENVNDNYFISGGCFWVAENKGKIIGTIAAQMENSKTPRLRRFFVLRKYRGKGVGSKLYRVFEDWGKQKGYEKIILSTYPQFKEAIDFYKYKGFREKEVNGQRIYYQKVITKK